MRPAFKPDQRTFSDRKRGAWVLRDQQPPCLAALRRAILRIEYARLDDDPFGQMQGFILAIRRDQLRTPGLDEAADRTLAAVAAALPGSRQVINDRGWASFQFLMFQADPLEHPSSEVVHEWGAKRPWSQVASFTAR